MLRIDDEHDRVLAALKTGRSFGLRLSETLHIGQRIYSVLHELESKGLVASYEADPTPERGNRPRRYYELTEMGLRFAE